MEKNWLIRTTSNKILGPISKEKLLEFIDKGALLQSDEVCSGNGYWFFLKEDDLMDQFLYGDMEQPFNPISECPTVLCAKNHELPEEEPDLEDDHTIILGSDALAGLKGNETVEPVQKNSPAQVQGDVCLPSNDDLEFPDIGGPLGDDPSSALPGEAIERKLDVPEEVIIDDSAPFEGKLPCEDDLEFPDMDMAATIETPSEPEVSSEVIAEMPSLPTPPEKSNIEEIEPPKHRGKIQKKKKPIKVENTKQNSRSDRYLFVIFFAMLGLVFYAVYYYYSKISTVDPTKKIEGFGSIIIPQAYAAETIVKKKVYFLK